MNEKYYLDAYSNLRLQHLETSVLSRLHERDQTLGSTEGNNDDNDAENHLRDGPSLHQHILVKTTQRFATSVEPLSIQILTDDMDDQGNTMEIGDMQIVPYNKVRMYIRDGSMEAR